MNSFTYHQRAYFAKPPHSCVNFPSSLVYLFEFMFSFLCEKVKMARRESEIQTARSIFSRQSGPLRSGRGGGGGVIQCCNPQWGLTHAHIAPMLQQSVIRWIGPPLLFLLEVINDFLWHAANSPSTVEALFLLAPPPPSSSSPLLLLRAPRRISVPPSADMVLMPHGDQVAGF